jgi:hypothetical protein
MVAAEWVLSVDENQTVSLERIDQSQGLAGVFTGMAALRAGHRAYGEGIEIYSTFTLKFASKDAFSLMPSRA